MTRANVLRILAGILALITAASHLTLSVVNLIPSETTVGPLFAAMGIGYAVGAIAIFLRKALIYRLVILYSIALILAYASSRDSLPIDPIGLLTKVDEGLLVLSLWLLIRTSEPKS